jgi:hypothetical protein
MLLQISDASNDAVGLARETAVCGAQQPLLHGVTPRAGSSAAGLVGRGEETVFIFCAIASIANFTILKMTSL